MATNIVSLELAGCHKSRINPKTNDSARANLQWLVSVIVPSDRNYLRYRTYTGYALAYYDHARNAGYTVADAYVRSVAFTITMLTRYYFGVWNLDTSEFSEHSGTIADIVAFKERVCGGAY